MKKYSFQPNGNCGNCQFYHRSKKDKNQNVIEAADCGKGHKAGKDCPAEDFQVRGKKQKRMSKRMQKWERQFTK